MACFEANRDAIIGYSRSAVVPIHLMVEETTAARSTRRVMAGGTGQASTFERLSLAAGSARVKNGWVEHPLSYSDVFYSLQPVTTEYHPSLDMAMLAAMYNRKTDDRYLYCGEVDPAGYFSPLAFPLEAGRLARKLNRPLVCPSASAPIAARTGAQVLGVANSWELADMGSQSSFLKPAPITADAREFPEYDDLAFIRGQEGAKWALEVAVAGGHNILFVGSPGEGKSSLASRAYTIASPLLAEEVIEVSSIWQGAGRLDPTELMLHRPYIEASKQTTAVALLGGGDNYSGARPGLVSLAHKGILLADEFFEWTRTTAESLRGPLQDRHVTLARRDWQFTFPADFQFIATANPCPCGHYGSGVHDCRCTEAARRRYLAKISGPIFDRIDIRVQVEALGADVLTMPLGEPSKDIAVRVQRAVDAQARRYQGSGITRNGELSAGTLDQFCDETTGARAVLGQVAREAHMSSRGVSKLRGLARTVADLRQSGAVECPDVYKAAELVRWEPTV